MWQLKLLWINLKWKVKSLLGKLRKDQMIVTPTPTTTIKKTPDSPKKILKKMKAKARKSS